MWQPVSTDLVLYVLLLVYVEALQNGVTIAKPGLKLLALSGGLSQGQEETPSAFLERLSKLQRLLSLSF